jgi:hypothetical protein
MYDKAYGGADMAREESAAMSPDMPLGENSVMSTVSITYEVK